MTLADKLRPCLCEASTARDGHIHEDDGSVLCLHYEGEDGTDCPAPKANEKANEIPALHGIRCVFMDGFDHYIPGGE